MIWKSIQMSNHADEPDHLAVNKCTDDIRQKLHGSSYRTFECVSIFLLSMYYILVNRMVRKGHICRSWLQQRRGLILVLDPFMFVGAERHAHLRYRAVNIIQLPPSSWILCYGWTCVAWTQVYTWFSSRPWHHSPWRNGLYAANTRIKHTRY